MRPPAPPAPALPGPRNFTPLAVVLAVAVLALFLSVLAAIDAQTRPGTGDPLSDTEVRQSIIAEALEPGSPRALPLMAVVVLALLVLVGGTGLLVMFAVKLLGGRRLLVPKWHVPVTWRPVDLLVVAGVWALAQLGGGVLMWEAGADMESLAPWLFQAALNGVLLAAVGLVVAARGGRAAALGLHAQGLGANVRLGLIAFLCVLPLHTVVMLLEQYVMTELGVRQVDQESVRLMLQTDSGIVLVAVPLLGILMAPVTEEIVFRGFVQGALRRACGPAPAIVGTAALFAAIHFNAFAFPSLLVLGLVLGYVYDRTQSIVGPVALHAAFNAATLALLGSIRLVQG